MTGNYDAKNQMVCQPLLEVHDLTIQYGKLTLVNQVSFSLYPGQWLMVIGPNGAGKSTIVNAVSQLIAYTGMISLNGKNIARCKPVELARQMGVLTQKHHISYSFTVEEVVKLGRYAHSRGIFSTPGEDDAQKIQSAIELTGLEALRHQSILTLSGGEMQRTFLAQVLAQDPRILILDEPTNHLDLVYQKQMFGLIDTWIKKTGGAVLSIVHDLSLAKAYGSHALLLDRGNKVASGKIGEVMTRTNLESIYAMDVYHWMGSMFAHWQEQVIV